MDGKKRPKIAPYPSGGRIFRTDRGKLLDAPLIDLPMTSMTRTLPDPPTEKPHAMTPNRDERPTTG
jgi:hypothetical protein